MLLSTQSGVEISLLPPFKDSIQMHRERVNYQGLLWYKSDKANPSTPSSSEESWEMENEQLAIKWSEGDLLLLELVQVLT